MATTVTTGTKTTSVTTATTTEQRLRQGPTAGGSPKSQSKQLVLSTTTCQTTRQDETQQPSRPKVLHPGGDPKESPGVRRSTEVVLSTTCSLVVPDQGHFIMFK